MEEILKVIGLGAFCGVKFFFAVPATVASGYSFFETILISSIGGIIFFLIFFYIGELKFIRYYLGKLVDYILGLFGLSLPIRDKKKKKFSKKNRMIVNIKEKYGIIGLAILTPSLLSIPLGSLLAARYFDRNKLIIPIMIGSILIWSFVLTTFYQIF